MSKYQVKRFSVLEDRGYGREPVLKGVGGAGIGAVAGGGLGAYFGGKKGMRKLEEGSSYDESLSKAGKKGAITGAITGGTLGFLVAPKTGDGDSMFEDPSDILFPIAGTAGGALGGYLGARKNFKVNAEEKGYKNDD